MNTYSVFFHSRVVDKVERLSAVDQLRNRRSNALSPVGSACASPTRSLSGGQTNGYVLVLLLSISWIYTKTLRSFLLFCPNSLSSFNNEFSYNVRSGGTFWEKNWIWYKSGNLVPSGLNMIFRVLVEFWPVSKNNPWVYDRVVWYGKWYGRIWYFVCKSMDVHA